MSLNPMNCCAVKELTGISYINDPHKLLVGMYKEAQYAPNQRPAFIIFTARAEDEYKYGRDFKKFILDNGLGEIVESHRKRNIRPEYKDQATHDMIIYIWEVNHSAYDAWYEKHKPVQVQVSL